ncbi:MAG: hypothetical protein WCZ28_06085 [Burkholderiaceae bacterium]
MAFKHASDGDTLSAGQWEVSGVIVHETEKALLLDDGASKQWLPKSKVTIERLTEDHVTVFMPEWLAKEKGYV